MVMLKYFHVLTAPLANDTDGDSIPGLLIAQHFT